MLLGEKTNEKYYFRGNTLDLNSHPVVGTAEATGDKLGLLSRSSCVAGSQQLWRLPCCLRLELVGAAGWGVGGRLASGHSSGEGPALRHTMPIVWTRGVLKVNEDRKSRKS